MAHRMGENYWLYIVTDAKTDEPKLFVVHDPATKLNPQEKVVRYIVTDWQEVATFADAAI